MAFISVRANKKARLNEAGFQYNDSRLWLTPPSPVAGSGSGSVR